VESFLQKSITRRFKNDLGLIVFCSILIFGLSQKTWAQENFRSISLGETFRYAIKKFGMKAGEASLTLNREKLDNRDFYLITFRAKAPNFFDEEKIYLDPQSFYPVIVKRDLNIFGKKEKITEIYDKQKGQILIRKELKGEVKEQTLHRQGPIDNIYCFLYRLRRGKAIAIGDSFSMNLPTRTVKIKVVEETKLKVLNKAFQAFYLESDPQQYKIWFDTSPQRIPLRIDGAMGLISTSLVLSDFQP